MKNLTKSIGKVKDWFLQDRVQYSLFIGYGFGALMLLAAMACYGVSLALYGYVLEAFVCYVFVIIAGSYVGWIGLRLEKMKKRMNENG